MLSGVIRTGATLIHGALLTWLAKAGILAWAAGAGLPVEAISGQLAVIIGAALAWVVYLVIRRLEQRWPAVGRWLLGLGVTDAQPQYRPPLR